MKGLWSLVCQSLILGGRREELEVEIDLISDGEEDNILAFFLAIRKPGNRESG